MGGAVSLGHAALCPGLSPCGAKFRGAHRCGKGAGPRGPYRRRVHAERPRSSLVPSGRYGCRRRPARPAARWTLRASLLTALVAAVAVGTACGQAWRPSSLYPWRVAPPIPAAPPVPAPLDGPRPGRLDSQRPWLREAGPVLAHTVPVPIVPGLPADLGPLMPSPGQGWLPGHRIVAYYGNPWAPGMGVLGQSTPAAMISRLDNQAAAYQRLDPATPVIPALELVADVAQAAPGPRGLYRQRMPYGVISQELALARRSHALLILDLQVGRSTVSAEVPYFLPFLAQPDVELALDPEFDMPIGEVPGLWIGTMPASQINWASRYLSMLVARYQLPPKMLIVHEFASAMVPGWRQIHLQSGVQFVMDTDGFGLPAKKVGNYRAFITDQPIAPARYGGIKLFYQADTPVLSPREVLALSPPPSLIIYQ